MYRERSNEFEACTEEKDPMYRETESSEKQRITENRENPMVKPHVSSSYDCSNDAKNSHLINRYS